MNGRGSRACFIAGVPQSGPFAQRIAPATPVHLGDGGQERRTTPDLALSLSIFRELWLHALECDEPYILVHVHVHVQCRQSYVQELPRSCSSGVKAISGFIINNNWPCLAGLVIAGIRPVSLADPPHLLTVDRREFFLYLLLGPLIRSAPSKLPDL